MVYIYVYIYIYYSYTDIHNFIYTDARVCMFCDVIRYMCLRLLFEEQKAPCPCFRVTYTIRTYVRTHAGTLHALLVVVSYMLIA